MIKTYNTKFYIHSQFCSVHLHVEFYGISYNSNDAPSERIVSEFERMHNGTNVSFIEYALTFQSIHVVFKQ